MTVIYSRGKSKATATEATMKISKEHQQGANGVLFDKSDIRDGDVGLL